MRAREQFYQDGELARVRAAIRRSQRCERVAWLVASVMVLAGLCALTVWLVGVVKAKAEIGNLEMGNQISAFCFPVSHFPLALAPMTKGAIGAGFLLISIAAVVLAVWKNEKSEDADPPAVLRPPASLCEALRAGTAWRAGTCRITEMEDPFADCTCGLTGDEMHRILVSVAAEAREVRHLQTVARSTVNLDDAEDALEVAGKKTEALIRCVEALCGRLSPVIAGDDDEDTVVLPGRGLELKQDPPASLREALRAGKTERTEKGGTGV